MVGISRYQHAGDGIPNLTYADQDAEAMARALEDPRFGAGGIPPERVRLLTNEQATYAKVREALFEFLGQASRDDMVVVFFAGHGTPDPARREDLYLVVHDTDPKRLSTTGLSMKEVDQALSRIRAERVLLFADACHSAGIVQPGMQLRGLGDKNPVNKFLTDLGRTSANRLIMTSSEADQTSLEGKRWNHGVFTWALLDALGGAADSNHDGVVALGEMLDFVRDQVETETGRVQKPVVAGLYDGRLPLTLVRAGAALAPDPIPTAVASRALAGPLIDLGTLTGTAVVQMPEAFFIMSSRELVMTFTPAEKKQVGKEVVQAVDAVVRARSEVTAASKLVRAALAAGQPADKQRKAVADLQTREQQFALEAIARLEHGIAAHLTDLGGSYWLALSDLYFERERIANETAYEAYDKDPDHAPAPGVPDYKQSTELLDRYLDLFRQGSLRDQALYRRALVSQEVGDDALTVAGHCLRAVAELPDHPYAAELYLRMAETYFDTGDLRLLKLAKESYLAALEHTPPGDPLRPLAMYKTAWTLYRLGDLAGARERFLALLAEPATAVDLGAEARQYVGLIDSELGDVAAVETGPLPVALRAQLLAASGKAAAYDDDDDRALDWLGRALALAPADPGALGWDQSVTAALDRLGRYAEEADHLEHRFEQFGPRSAWFKLNGKTQPPELLEQLTDDVLRGANVRSQPARSVPAPTLKAAALRFVTRLDPAYRRCGHGIKLGPGQLRLQFEWDDAGVIVATHVSDDTFKDVKTTECIQTQTAARRMRPGAAGTARVMLVF